MTLHFYGTMFLGYFLILGIGLCRGWKNPHPWIKISGTFKINECLKIITKLKNALTNGQK